MQLHFLSILVLLNIALAQFTSPSPGGKGESCFVGGFAIPRPCASGLTCVLSSFGDPALDGPRTGKCQRLTSKPPLCSIEVCSSTGADTLCRASAFANQPADLVATCRAWATRTDTGGEGPDCAFVCTLECRFPLLVASDGSKFCNLCTLQAASCRSNFEIFGPVPPSDKCKPPISFFDAAECCRERGIGCLGKGAKCSTAGSRVPPVPCKKGLTCVISDFGFPAADRPNAGKCLRVRRRLPGCTLGFCSRFGPRPICRVLEPRNSGIVSRCKAWARRSDGNPGPDCAFACPQFCLPERQQPLASNGKKFCTPCILLQASCSSDFMIYGPVRG